MVLNSVLVLGHLELLKLSLPVFRQEVSVLAPISQSRWSDSTVLRHVWLLDTQNLVMRLSKVKNDNWSVKT